MFWDGPTDRHDKNTVPMTARTSGGGIITTEQLSSVQMPGSCLSVVSLRQINYLTTQSEAHRDTDNSIDNNAE